MKYRMDSFIRYLSGICRTYAILKISRIKIHFQNSLIVKRISILFYKNVSLDRRESIKLVCTQFHGIFISLFSIGTTWLISVRKILFLSFLELSSKSIFLLNFNLSPPGYIFGELYSN